MHIRAISISGFRCFGPEPTRISLSPDLTVIVGPNASGKTALLQSLARIFGTSRIERTVQRSDFHRPPEIDPDDRSARELVIEVEIGLPELLDGSATSETVAPCFRNLRIEHAGEEPACRLRLEARWEDDGTIEGDITQNLYWVDTLDPTVTEDQKNPVSSSDRGLIQLHYVPASRDATAQIRATTGALAARLLRAIEWSPATRKAIEGASQSIGSAFEAETAIKAISSSLASRWSNIHDEATDIRPGFSLVSRRFEEVIRRITVLFQQGPDGQERDLTSLSDGQQSLFYFALAAAVFDLERSVVAGDVAGFRADEMNIPPMTIFALEEPENHLSPYYLARIIQQVLTLVAGGNSQALLTSHSPSVLSRVQPTNVRYCRRSVRTGISSVRPIELPEGHEEAEKFVRNAMLAFPELYFARFVLLVEGDSERLVLPKLAEALDIVIDPAFVAIVPLGGRHVQHFWRLLDQLDIPFATLLDLDLGRHGGGFGRVKTAIQNLIELGVSKSDLLQLPNETLTSDKDLEDMHTWQDASKIGILMRWVDNLRKHNVFFSTPLDLDLAMLRAFPAAYEAIIPTKGGPRTSGKEAAKAVLGVKGPGLALYAGELSDCIDLFPAYRYHFMTHSKPATHLAALTHLSREAIQAEIPEPLRSVLNHLAAKMRRD